MKCEICGKNTATIHYTEIINEKLREIHLCEWCAQQKEALVKPHFSTAEFLSGMLDVEQIFAERQVKKCARCGFSRGDFQKLGRLGCSECYQVFREDIRLLLKRIHGSSQHAGNTPSVSKRKDTTIEVLNKLRQELKVAISREKFEEAARLRDKIREMEKACSARGKGNDGTQ